MRTNIDIDDKLMKQAMKATGARTKRAAVEASLRQTVQLKKQQGIRKLFGKVGWRGHDDAWSVTDEEILKNRREPAPRTSTTRRKPPMMAEQRTSFRKEARR
jgi:Arc/MetJ family transcription regulator